MSGLFKKRNERSSLGRTVDPSSVVAADPKSQIVLDYVLSHAKNDTRPYLNIIIYGCDVLALLDSGATRTILGGPGWSWLEKLCPLNTFGAQKCTVANGESCHVIGSISLPITLCGRTKILEVLVVPSVTHKLILGMDFWRIMQIIPDMFSGSWSFRDSTEVTTMQTVALHSIDTLSSEQLELLTKLIDATFQAMGTKLGCTALVEHVIHTDSAPIKQRHYPISPALQRQVYQELDKMLADGVVEPSNSPWASPILLIRKDDGKYRFVVDFRQLNKVTTRDAYPLPFISATLDKLRDAHYLTTLDIKSAYWQIPLSEESKPLTAFVIPNRGLYQFRRMPMGLHNAPATWQRFIDRVIGVDLEKYVFVYLDDVIVCTDTFERHLEILKEVLRRLMQAGLTLNRDKCHFCKAELRYLGYVVGSSGLMVDPAKVEAILKIPPPRNTTEVRRIIGVASWYRRFVPNFSSLTAPLCNLLKKNIPFIWDDLCDNAFRLLKDHLISAPVLSCPNFDLPFLIQTDASDFGLGAVLTQVVDGVEKVISYLSRSLTKNERKFSVTEKECLAVLFAIEKWRPYVEGTHFIVITDHYSLKWLNTIKDPVGRIARWAVRLQQYDFDIVHRKGKDHIVPDILSRSVPSLDLLEPVTCDVDFPSGDNWYDNMCRQVQQNPRYYPLWRLEGNQLFKRSKLAYPGLAEKSHAWLMVVPKSKRADIIKENHDPPTCGHLGVFKTSSRISSKYYWPKLKQDCSRYIRRCNICLSTKPEQKAPAGLMLSLAPIITRPWKILSMDIVGPLPRSAAGYSYILSVVDIFSKFVLLFPLRSVTAAAVAKIFEEHVILLFGAPQKVITDNGVQFRSNQYKSLLHKYDIVPGHIANYHAQANPVERVHRVVKTILTSYVADNHRLWDKYLAQVACALRSSRHETTKFTPNFVMFGREISLLGKESHPLATELDTTEYDVQLRSETLQDVFKDVSKRLKEAYDRSSKRYNLRRRDEKFQLHQRVWKRNYTISDASKGVTSKLSSKFEGPYTIIKVVSPWSYELMDDTGRNRGVWHAKDIKAHPPDDV